MEAALTGNTNLLKEMKRIKSGGINSLPDHVDSKTGSDIPDHFADIYEDLFNSVQDEGLDELRDKMKTAGIHAGDVLSLIHISEPTRLLSIS